jgi:hypothetical protein
MVHQQINKDKAIPSQAWTDPEGSRRLRRPDFKTMAHESGKVVSPNHRPTLPPENIPGTYFYQRLDQSLNHSSAGRIMSMNNSNDTIGNRTRDITACSAVPQPTGSLPQQINKQKKK